MDPVDVSRTPGRLRRVGLAICVLVAVVVTATLVWDHFHPVHRTDAEITGQVLVSADGRTITTAATWTGCEAKPRLLAHETEKSVELKLRRESHATPGMVCDDQSAKQVTTTLKMPLTSKTLVDATTGHPIAFLGESDLVNPNYVPVGYAPSDIVLFGLVGQVPPPPYEKFERPTWTRTYQSVSSGEVLTISQVLGDVVDSYGIPTTVNGYTAYLVEEPSPGGPSGRIVKWFDGSHTFVVLAYDKPGAVSREEFMSIAEGIYRLNQG